MIHGTPCVHPSIIICSVEHPSSFAKLSQLEQALFESEVSVFGWPASEQMRMWATLSPTGSSVSLNWLKPSEQKYQHACVFAAAWGNILMPRLIRLTLTIPQGKSQHICNRQIITNLRCFFLSFLCVCFDVFYIFGRPSVVFFFFFWWLGWASFPCISSSS